MEPNNRDEKSENSNTYDENKRMEEYFLSLLEDIPNKTTYRNGIEQILSNYMNKTPTEYTFSDIQSDLSNLFGMERSKALAYAIVFGTDSLLESSDLSETHIEGLDFVRYISSVYGRYLNYLHRYMVFGAHNWETLDVNVNQSVTYDEWKIDLNILKYNNENCYLSLNIDSTLSLINSLLIHINDLPEDTIQEYIDQDDSALLMKNLDDFKNKLSK